MGKKKLSKKEQPNVNPELEGFDIKINSFGEITSNYEIDKINDFLNKKVDDKKLRGRDVEEEKAENEKNNKTKTKNKKKE